MTGTEPGDEFYTLPLIEINIAAFQPFNTTLCIRDATEFWTSEIRCNEIYRVELWPHEEDDILHSCIINTRMCKLRVRLEVKHTYLLISAPVISWITSPLDRKIHFPREYYVTNTKTDYTWYFFGSCPSNHITDGSVYTITLIVSYLQKALIKSGGLLHKMVLNTLGVASDGCNRLRRVFCGCTGLRWYFVENDATDLGMCNIKRCNGRLEL